MCIESSSRLIKVLVNREISEDIGITTYYCDKDVFLIHAAYVLYCQIPFAFRVHVYDVCIFEHVNSISGNCSQVYFTKSNSSSRHSSPIEN